MTKVLPDVIQEPDCGQTFDKLSIVNIESRDSSELQLGTVVGQGIVKVIADSIVIETEDLSLAGKSMTVTLSVEAGDNVTAVVDYLKASISFQNVTLTDDGLDSSPKDIEANSDFFKYLVVPSITCSQADADWLFPLSQIFGAEDESKDLELTLMPGLNYDQLFTLTPEGDTLMIDP